MDLANHGASALRDMACLRLDTENLDPKPEMGLDVEEGLTENNVGGNVKDGIGGKVMGLKVVKLEEALEEGVDRKPQTLYEEGVNTMRSPF